MPRPQQGAAVWDIFPFNLFMLKEKQGESYK